MTAKVSAEEPFSRTLIRETDELYYEFVKEISAARSRIRQGDLSNLKETTRSLRELRVALQHAMEERTKIAKLEKESTGIVYDYALDFDAARVEIGRRLALLRDAGDG